MLNSPNVLQESNNNKNETLVINSDLENNDEIIFVSTGISLKDDNAPSIEKDIATIDLSDSSLSEINDTISKGKLPSIKGPFKDSMSLNKMIKAKIDNIIDSGNKNNSSEEIGNPTSNKFCNNSIPVVLITKSDENDKSGMISLATKNVESSPLSFKELENNNNNSKAVSNTNTVTNYVNCKKRLLDVDDNSNNYNVETVDISSDDDNNRSEQIQAENVKIKLSKFRKNKEDKLSQDDTENGLKLFKCMKCELTFTDKDLLLSHMRISHLNGLDLRVNKRAQNIAYFEPCLDASCPVVLHNSTWASHLMCHMEQTDNPCKDCSFNSKSISGLIQHTKAHRSKVSIF